MSAEIWIFPAGFSHFGTIVQDHMHKTTISAGIYANSNAGFRLDISAASNFEEFELAFYRFGMLFHDSSRCLSILAQCFALIFDEENVST